MGTGMRPWSLRATSEVVRWALATQRLGCHFWVLEDGRASAEWWTGPRT